MSRIKITDLIPPPEELDNKKMKGIFGGLSIYNPGNISNSLFNVCTNATGGHSLNRTLFDPSISMQTNVIK